MKLARIFQNYMVIQRNKKVKIWGTSDIQEQIQVEINGEKVGDYDIPKGKFSFEIPEQPTMEDATIVIGDITITHVDFGEVWIAGGQSNMEFMLKYEEHGDEIVANAFDDHIRNYTVGQYAFEGNREEGIVGSKQWDRWLQFHPEYAAEMPAVAIFFAQEIRKQGVPVGIVNCSWGGTSAAAWIDKCYLEQDSDLREYIKEFDQIVSQVNLERYLKMEPLIRKLASLSGSSSQDFIMKHTYRPEELDQKIGAMMGTSVKDDAMQQMIMVFTPEELNLLSKLEMTDYTQIGPHDKNRPSALYEYMMCEIKGFAARGVIWYQGENDTQPDYRVNIYAKLFEKMIHCWRTDWNEQLPFIYVQLAPYGTWQHLPNTNYAKLREQQQMVANKVENVYMTSISDLGNVFDIHPKKKQQVGLRLALLANRYIYQQANVYADAPEAKSIEKVGNTVTIKFNNGDGLHMLQEEFDSYNGFALDQIPEELIPPVLDQVNGLSVIVDDQKIKDVKCEIENDQMIMKSDLFEKGKKIRVEFANIGFYKVNIFNKSEIPVKPFVMEAK